MYSLRIDSCIELRSLAKTDTACCPNFYFDSNNIRFIPLTKDLAFNFGQTMWSSRNLYDVYHN